jgi:hypothetical protein
MDLPAFGMHKHVRVCDGCFHKRDGASSQESPRNPGLSRNSSTDLRPDSQRSSGHLDSTIQSNAEKTQEDIDFATAIALSLKMPHTPTYQLLRLVTPKESIQAPIYEKEPTVNDVYSFKKPVSSYTAYEPDWSAPKTPISPAIASPVHTPQEISASSIPSEKAQLSAQEISRMREFNSLVHNIDRDASVHGIGVLNARSLDVTRISPYYSYI